MAEIEKAYPKAVLGGAVFVLILILAILAIVKFSVGEIDRDDFGPLVFVLSWMAVALFFTNLLFARYRRKIRQPLLEKELGMPRETKETARLPESHVVPLSSVTEQTTARLSQEIPLPRDNEQVR
jgi:hypothetical protein